MNKKTIIISIIAIFGFLFVVYNLINTSQPTVYKDVNIIKPDDHVAWSPEKKNILVEYSDFECPACRNFHILLKQMEATSSPDFKITQKVTLVYRYFPLYQIHPNSMTAAYAAEAAGVQEKFFEMSNLLFNKQDEWAKLSNPNDYFVKLASQLQLDINKFKTDMDSQAVKDKVNADLESGNKANVNATPTFFLNGQKLDDIKSFDQFKNLLLSL